MRFKINNIDNVWFSDVQCLVSCAHKEICLDIPLIMHFFYLGKNVKYGYQHNLNFSDE